VAPILPYLFPGADPDLPAQGPAGHAGGLSHETTPWQTLTVQAFKRGALDVWSLFALVLAVAPLVFTSSLGMTMLSQMGIAIIACLSYNMLLGQGGMLSFGHAVYTGLGSFLAIHALNVAGDGVVADCRWCWSRWWGAGRHGVCRAAGLCHHRKAGTTFAMITLGMGELVFAMSLMFPEFFGGEGGVSGNRVMASRFLGITFGPPIQVYYLIAVYTFMCVAAMFAFTRTPLGRMLNAVRDNPERVEFVGYNTQRVRYTPSSLRASLPAFPAAWGAELRNRHGRGGGCGALGCLPAVHLPGRRHLLLRAHHRRGADGAGFVLLSVNSPRPGCCTWG
jgi:branched-subunit amino acid ABC-type transport system permease component